jgi:hypothetical protein
MGKVLSGAGFLLALLIATQGCAMGTKRPDLLTITGTVRVVGSAPLTRLVLTTVGSTEAGGKKDWLLLGPLQEKLRAGYQGREVTLEGTTCESPSPEIPQCLNPSRILE